MVYASMNLDLLNPEQRRAVLLTEGPVLVLAGAGAGKTRVITWRIAYLIEQGAPPDRILAVTFTNKAAREMKERVEALIGRSMTGDVTVGTFHAVCARLLRRHADRLGLRPSFGIASTGYQQGLVQSIIGELGLDDAGGGSPGQWLARISRCKSALLRPEDVQPPGDAVATPVEQALPRVYAEYDRRLHAMDLVDFDDLLVLTARLWEEDPDLLEFYRDRFRYILVDEYQDTNHVQFHLIQRLAGERRNVCAVGDDDQSIYGWRGADIENILRFESAFPGTRVIRLEQNYRSTMRILAVANAVIGANPKRHEKKLWSTRGEGAPVRVVRATDEVHEAEVVVEVIRDLRARRRLPFEAFAILLRSNKQGRVFEQVLRKWRIPYRVVGGRSFYEHREILDAVAFLECAVNPGDDLSLLQIVNVPPRGVGEKTLAAIRERGRATGAALQEVLLDADFLETLPPETAAALAELAAVLADARADFSRPGGLREKTERLLRRVGYLDGLARIYKPRENALKRRDRLLDFLDSIGEFESRDGPDVRRFLEQFALRDDADRVDGAIDQDAVVLSTVHAAKGLEFPIVFVPGLEQDLFPHERALKDRALDEERRLFYVALTRARDELYLTFAERRRVRGALRRRRSSVFLHGLPSEHVVYCNAEDVLPPASPEEVRAAFRELRARIAAETGGERRRRR